MNHYTNPIDCYHCGKQLADDEAPNQDSDGNWYHPECGEKLRDMSSEYDNLASAEGDYLRKTGYTPDF